MAERALKALTKASGVLCRAGPLVHPRIKIRGWAKGGHGVLHRIKALIAFCSLERNKAQNSA